MWTAHYRRNGQTRTHMPLGLTRCRSTYTYRNIGFHTRATHRCSRSGTGRATVRGAVAPRDPLLSGIAQRSHRCQRLVCCCTLSGCTCQSTLPTQLAHHAPPRCVSRNCMMANQHTAFGAVPHRVGRACRLVLQRGCASFDDNVTHRPAPQFMRFAYSRVKAVARAAACHVWNPSPPPSGATVAPVATTLATYGSTSELSSSFALPFPVTHIQPPINFSMPYQAAKDQS